MEHFAYIGIGSNLGNKLKHCAQAIEKILEKDSHRLLAKSSFFKTEPVGYVSQGWFVNGVIKIQTALAPLELLDELKSIESRLGRKESFRWGPRIIDLDILFYDDLEMHTEEIQIPHPRLQDRPFVLIPLTEIDPSLIHPVFKKTIRELLADCKEKQTVEKI